MSAFLFDLDGTLYQGDVAIPGAPEFITRLRDQGKPFRFVTNTTSRPRSSIVARLRSYGFQLADDEVFTALLAGAALARNRGCDTLLPLVPPASLTDLEGFTLVGGTSGSSFSAASPAGFPAAVLVGDLGPLWSFDLVQQAFTALLNGALLIALSRDRYWMSSTGLTVDCGAFVAALEYASGKIALLGGKPSAEFYHAAVQSLGPEVTPGDVVMIGDDIVSDVGGAQQAGYQGYLVRTGKYSEAALQASGVRPDRILASVIDLDT